MPRRRCLPVGVVQMDLFAQPPTLPDEAPDIGPAAPLPPEAAAPDIQRDLVTTVGGLVGLAGEVMGALCADDRRYLTGPAVFHPGSECADWLRAAIPDARLRHILHAPEGEHHLATLEEALAYLSSASLAIPLGSDDAEQFFWLSQELLPRYGLARDEPVWKSLGYEAPITLSRFQIDQLRDLRAKIRAAVIANAAIARMQGIRRNRQHSTHARREEGDARPLKRKVRVRPAEVVD
jgi:hypothetical protein